MKNQRLHYEILVDSLKDRQLVDPEALNHILHQCESTGALLPGLLVTEGLISDWELARVTCDVFGLPFLPLEAYEPNAELIDKLDPNFLRQYQVVPLDRFGKLVTVAMPGMVPGEVLAEIEEKLEVKVLPIVGSVAGNMRWLEDHLPPPDAIEFEAEADDGAWSNVLDMGDQAVQSGIQPGSAEDVAARQAEDELASTLELFDMADESVGSDGSNVDDVSSLTQELELELSQWQVQPGDEDQDEVV